MRYRIIPHLSLFVISFAWIGCQKEYSYEVDSGTQNPGGSPPLGANCRVEQIIAADSATGTGLFSLYTVFNSSSVATRVEAYDSISGTTDYSVDLSYVGDTIRLSGSNEFYITDASKRLFQYHTYQDPADTTSEKVVYTYTYDGSGYLTKKEVSIESIPVPVAQFDYVWNGGNMLSVDGYIPVIGQKIITAQLEYDASKTVKNFIPIFPDGIEFAPFVLAFGLGKKSANVLSRITMNLYDTSGNVNQTLVTSLKNYTFSSDGYLLEWFAEGDTPAGLPLLAGRTKFKYRCN